MAHTLYTDEQISILTDNPYVDNCFEKYIAFSDECKTRALHLYSTADPSPKEIFRTLGFPDFIIDSDVPKNSLNRWKRTLLHENANGVAHKKKGRKKKVMA